MKLREYQKEAVAAIKGEFRNGTVSTLLVMATGTGKCHRKGTKVLMFDCSIKNIEEVKIGDVLMGDDSTPRQVLRTGFGFGQMFRVHQKGKPSYDVNKEHILALQLTSLKADRPNYRLSYISDSTQYWASANQKLHLSVKDYFQQTNTFKHCAKGYSVPLEFKEQFLQIEPYLVGVWLGDGNSNLQTFGVTSIDTEIIEYLQNTANYYNLRLRGETCHNTRTATYMVEGVRGKPNPLTRQMRQLFPQSKHSGIPKQYIINSRKHRLELLAGLIDTDGSITENNYEITQKNEILAKDIAFLARSLGFRVYLRSCQKTCVNTGATGTYWRIGINGNCSTIPVKIARKKIYKRLINKNPLLCGINIEPLAEFDEFYGVVTDCNHLYLLEDLTVVHNTIAFCQLASEAVARTQKPVLVLAHRAELLTQAQDKLTQFGLTSSLEKAQSFAFGRQTDVVVASVQSLSQPDRLTMYPADYFSLVICDEAHHFTSRTFKSIVDYFAPTRTIGVTATPNRHDEIGLKNVFQSCAYQYSIKDGIKDGYLCPINAMQVQVEDLRLEDVKIVAGEFSNTQLNAMLMQEKVLQRMCLPTIEYAENRPTIIFTESVEHAHAIVKCFERITGKDCATVVDGKMNAETRERNLSLFESGKKQFISNVGVLTEGYDHPPTACIALFRPMRSVGLLAQMIGRGTRIAEGKTDCRILDFVGVSNTVRTANIFDVLDGSILNAEEKEKALEFAAEGEDSLTALEKAKRFVAELESVKAKMRCFSTSRDFDILGLFAIESCKGLYGGDLATAPQRKWLTDLGIKVSPELQKGEAMRLLDRIVKRRTKGLATFKQMKELKRLGYESNFLEEVKFDDAKRIIGELRIT